MYDAFLFRQRFQACILAAAIEKQYNFMIKKNQYSLVACSTTQSIYICGIYLEEIDCLSFVANHVENASHRYNSRKDGLRLHKKLIVRNVQTTSKSHTRVGLLVLMTNDSSF